jgi:glyoxylase-like metal-dependent hydrolase (beta-lactamase superfamily II)
MMKVPLSDHFDGNRFFNPTLPKGFAPSRLDAIKMAREPHSQWPTWVQNTGVHRLNEMRAADEIAAITFVNHATFLIETGGITILTDPIWSERASPFRGIGPKRVRAPGVAFEDIPRVDVILLSHNHYDHLDVATPKASAAILRPNSTCCRRRRADSRALGVQFYARARLVG